MIPGGKSADGQMRGGMHPGEHAARTPDKPALIEADTGAVLTWRELDDRSNRLAQLLYLRERVARYMLPKSIDFIDEMPRLSTGKLYKQGLRDRYRTPA